MNVAPGNVTLVVKIRAGALTGEAAKPKPLTNNRSWEAPPSQGPTERQRLAGRAHLDRDIVYFLQEPSTNAFFLSTTTRNPGPASTSTSTSCALAAGRRIRQR